MHGWGGARAQMTGFVEPLLAAGYRVVAYDQPAHGESDGRMTNIIEITPTMDLVMKRERRFDAINAYSFGTFITSYALTKRNFPTPSKLVYFGSFNRLMDALPRFQAQANLPDAIIDGLRAMIYQNFEEGVLDTIINETLTPQIDIPTLMFHDTTDNVTPVEDSRAIATVWKNAQFIETDFNAIPESLREQTQALTREMLTWLQKTLNEAGTWVYSNSRARPLPKPH